MFHELFRPTVPGGVHWDLVGLICTWWGSLGPGGVVAVSGLQPGSSITPIKRSTSRDWSNPHSQPSAKHTSDSTTWEVYYSFIDGYAVYADLINHICIELNVNRGIC